MSISPERVRYLDGLRGIAAVAVVLFHFLYFFLPAAIFGSGPGKLGSAEIGWLHDSLLYGLVSGSFAVSVFFVLSGFVLGLPYCLNRERQTLFRSVYRRYPRLALPILATNLLYGLLMATNLISAQLVATASAITGTLSEGNSLGQPVHWLELIRFSLWDVFSHIHYEVNPVLWTMHIEMIGSLLVFGLLLLFGRSAKRWWAYGLLGLIGLWRYPLFLSFLLGLLLCEAYILNRLGWLKSPVIQIPLLLLVFYLAAIPTHPFSFYTQTTTYSWVASLTWLPIENRRWLVLVIAAAALIAIILQNQWLQRILQNRLAIFLGRISFSLYLVHMAVVSTVCTQLFLWLGNDGDYLGAAIISFAIGFPVCLGVAWFVTRWIDEPAIRFSRNFALGVDAFIRRALLNFQFQKNQSVTTGALHLPDTEAPKVI